MRSLKARKGLTVPEVNLGSTVPIASIGVVAACDSTSETKAKHRIALISIAIVLLIIKLIAWI